MSNFSAHALASLSGIPCDSSRGNSGLCLGNDSRTVGVFGFVREVTFGLDVGLSLRDVLAIRCNCSARDNLEFVAMIVAEARWLTSRGKIGRAHV